MLMYYSRGMHKGYEDLKGSIGPPLCVPVTNTGLYVRVLIHFTMLEGYLLDLLYPEIQLLTGVTG